ncbi:MAG: hypothetical protein KGI59_03585 [Patescibacteria group bacterium]|nr:hypothetical protein [Patescibacteria group bacterium]
MGNPNRLPIAILVAAIILAGAVLLKGYSPAVSDRFAAYVPTSVIMMDGGHLLPMKMENMMIGELVKTGVIDPARLPQATELDILWAFGLANKNPVLSEGPMMDPSYGGVQNFASTGGWMAAKGSAMDHYGMHAFMSLTPEQQALVEKVAKNTFRPCCKNSAYFPDCNHGMAMLGLLEILASQGLDESGLKIAANRADSIWFPGQRQAGYGIDPVQPETIVQPQRLQISCGL